VDPAWLGNESEMGELVEWSGGSLVTGNGRLVPPIVSPRLREAGRKCGLRGKEEMPGQPAKRLIRRISIKDSRLLLPP
jgi:hypothetical protein